MKIASAYLGVVLIWSTTPLAIKWSNSSLSFVTAVSARVFIGLAICLLILAVMRKPLVKQRDDWQAFFAGLIGLFPNMLLVYWSAQHIPSALAAVIFGLYPFMVGVFSFLIMKENIFTIRRVIALVVALSGLIVINLEQFSMGGSAVYGVIGMMASTVLFGLSSVWVKHVGVEVDPFRQTTGVLLLAAPLFGLSWFIFDGVLPTFVDSRSLTGVLYLSFAGTLLGGTLFYYVLRNCHVSSVGLITFITPVTALFIGVLLDGERISPATVVGCVLIIVSLAIYQNLFGYLSKLYRTKQQLRLQSVG